MNRIKLPLALSIAGHAVVLALLILFAAATRPFPETAMPGGFEVVLGQPVPEAKPLPAPQALPSQAAAVTQPERPVEAAEPAPAPAPEVPVPPPDQTAAVPAPPPPQRKPVIREPPKHVTHRPERSRAPVSEPTPTPSKFAQMSPAGVAGAQDSIAVAAASVAAPAPVPRPDVTASYQAMISAWLESHKRYPESARERGEEGNAALRFRIDRSGRVLDYSYRSTGYADLDAGLDEMLRGAQLPPFPPSMTASRIEVSLTMQFNLTR
ncbi:MAG TPA: energy transducer TonB [Stellaceae bacterium]|nr:energy transducer TonB [Stellaceae bacterium]